MSTTINRITAIFGLIAFFQFSLLAQTLPPVIPSFQIFPKENSVSPSESGILTPGAQEFLSPAFSESGNYPSCGFDEMNELRGQADPAFAKELKKYLEEVVPALAASGEKGAVNPLMTISIVVHVIHNGEPVGLGANLSDAQIYAQIAVLNKDFAALNASFDKTPSKWKGVAGIPNIEFCPASVDPFGNPTNGITRHNLEITGTSWSNNNINSSIKPATKWDPLRYFNVYVLGIPGTTEAGGVVGYSNYPSPGLIGADQDGVVIDYRWFGAPGYPTSGWKALVHETGHYLGLPHTFQGNSCSQDDGIEDTPNIEKATRELATLDCANGYPPGPVSCGNEHLYVNFMDYVVENCYTSFTAQQANVMRAVLNGTSQGFNYGSRNQLILSAPTQCNIPANDAGIVNILAPAQTTCTPDTLQPIVTLRNFGTTDLSSASIVSKVNNTVVDTFFWQGNLISGENADVVLPAYQAPNESYSLSFYTLLPNGAEDENVHNDSISGGFYTYLAIPTPLKEDFENDTALPTNSGFFSFNPNEDPFEWELSSEASAWGQGTKSVVFDNYAGDAESNPFGTLDALISRHFDLSKNTGTELKFDVAYAPFDDFLSDTLFVLTATDCSQDFNQIVYKKGGDQLSTAPWTEEPFVPTATQWRTETIDLSAYDGMDDVAVAFVNVSRWGNRIYLDNIQLGVACNSLSYSWDLIPTSCNLQPGDPCDGSATIKVANHNGGLSYQWEGWPGHNLPTIYQLCPGAISVTVTDAFGCTLTAATSIVQSPAPILNMTTTAETAYNAADGTATTTVSNGSAPYSYFWSNGQQELNSDQNTSTITGLTPGNYQATVTDASGCEGVAQGTVTSVCGSFLAAISVANVSCYGGSNGSVNASSMNGQAPFTYLWNTGATTALLPNQAAGTYSVTVTDANGCEAAQSATINQPTAIVLSVSSTDETAVNANNGTATATVSGGTPGYFFLWSNGANTAAISGLAPGVYSLTLTDNAGCTASASTTIQAYSCGGFSASMATADITCHSQNNGTATATAIGGVLPYTYQWSNGQNSQSVNSLLPGNVSVTVTDGLGCSVVLSTVIAEPPALILVLTHTDETGAGLNNGAAISSVSGGVPHPDGAYSYSWSNGATTASIQNLPPDQYSLTVTDANGCTASGVVFIAAFNCFLQIELSATPASCPEAADGFVEVASIIGGSGPFEYLWSDGQTFFLASNLVAGSYSITVTDGTGCTATGTATVGSTDNTKPIALAKNITAYLNENGVVVLDPSELDNGSYDNCGQLNFGLIPAQFNCDNLGANSATLVVSDLSGNSSTANVIVTVVDTLAPVITCPADTAYLNCVFSYPPATATDNCGSFTLSLLSGIASGDVFPVGATEIAWKAVDASGNESFCTTLIEVISDLEIGYDLTEPSCFGDSDGSIDLTVSGGQSPYQILWSSLGSENLAAGQYGVTVTDAGQCSVEETIELTQPEALEFHLLGTTPAGDGLPNGTIDFNISGGTPPYETAWTLNGNPTPNFNPLAASPGAYQALVTDAKGCSVQSELILVDNIDAANEALEHLQFRLFPNPNSGAFWLEFESPRRQAADISVLDLTGRPIYQIKEKWMSRQPKRIELQGVAPGVYWVKILSGGNAVWRKLVVIQ